MKVFNFQECKFKTANRRDLKNACFCPTMEFHFKYYEKIMHTIMHWPKDEEK